MKKYLLICALLVIFVGCAKQNFATNDGKAVGSIDGVNPNDEQTKEKFAEVSAFDPSSKYAGLYQQLWVDLCD